MASRSFFPIWRLLLGGLLALSTNASAGVWPEGYVVHHDTESPDGRYGIAVTTEESGTEAVNYLADLKTHQVLGKIACGDYFERENHRDLRAVWADDSTWCVAVYTERFSFGSIAILERNDSGLKETDIDERISKSLQGAAGDEGYGDVHFRCTADRKLLARAIFYTGNPKMNDAKTRYARFEGTFDLNSGKWTKVEARRMNLPKPAADDGEVFSAVYLALMTAYSRYSPADLTLPPNSSDKEKAARLDEMMNQVYQGVRAVPPGTLCQREERPDRLAQNARCRPFRGREMQIAGGEDPRPARPSLVTSLRPRTKFDRGWEGNRHTEAGVDRFMLLVADPITRPVPRFWPP